MNLHTRNNFFAWEDVMIWVRNWYYILKLLACKVSLLRAQLNRIMFVHEVQHQSWCKENETLFH